MRYAMQAIRAVVLTAALAGTSAAWGQSSSLFHRGQRGPRPAAAPPVSAAPAAVAAPAALTPTSQPATGVLLSFPGVPSQADTPVVQASSMANPLAAPADTPIAAATPPPAPGSRDAAVSPAVAALQAVSFTSSAPVQPRTYQVHDLITIIVREESSFTSDGKTDLEKKASLDAKLLAWMKFQSKNPPLKSVPLTNGTTPELKTEAERKFEGDGKINRRDTFIGRLTSEVIDIKPNGTMVLAAKKYIKTDDEEQYFELSGMCRLADVNADNTVLSTQLADLTVMKTHKGAVRDSTKRGILPWATDKINPW